MSRSSYLEYQFGRIKGADSYAVKFEMRDSGVGATNWLNLTAEEFMTVSAYLIAKEEKRDREESLK